VDQLNGNELTLRDIGQAWQRRKWVILCTTAVCFLLAVVACIVSPRRYVGVATIELQNKSLNGLDRETLLGTTALSTDSLADTMAIQTQARILESDTLALRTMAALKMTDGGGFLINASFPSAPHDNINELPTASAGNPESISPYQDKAVKLFRKNLTVKPIGGTHLLEVSYTDKDPQRAAAVANELVRQLVEYNEETQSGATMEASKELGKQLEHLRVQSEMLEKRVVAIQAQTGTYIIGAADDQGRQQAYSAVLSQFQKAADVLSDATQNRILKESVYHVAKTGDAELISGLMGNGIGGAASSGVMNSLGMIQNLRVQESTEQAQLEQLKVKFGPGYPKVAELEASIAATGRAIHDEVQRIAKRAENDFAVADRTWNEANKNYAALKSQADSLNAKNIQYMMARQEADESRIVYADLTKRLTAAGILQGLRSSTITVVDMARPPHLPSKPDVPMYLAAGLGAGLICGFVIALVREATDDSILHSSAIEQLGLSLLGVLPGPRKVGSKSQLDANRGSQYSNALRTIRSALVLGPGRPTSKLILISPITPSEGTCRLSVNLVANAAQPGRRVLLVEADARICAADDTDFSRQDGPVAFDLATAFVPHAKVPGLFVLPARTLVDGAPEFFESGGLKAVMSRWQEQFDLVVICAQSPLVAPDAGLIARYVDAVILVATYGVTTKSSLGRACAMLLKHSASVGVVLDQVPVNSSAYRDYYGFTGPVYKKGALA
jgi:polysaccharide biosynthesis transport protein